MAQRQHNPHLTKKYWQQSSHLFFTPKLSLEGKNLFPQITESSSIHTTTRDHQPFLNVAKKPIMNMYERINFISEKKPVCVIGLTKQVEARSVRTGNLRRSKISDSMTNSKEIRAPDSSLSTFSPILLSKSELDRFDNKKYSKKLLAINETDKNKEKTLYYYIGSGNNSELVEKVFLRRSQWQQTTTSLYNFRWEPARSKYQNGNTLSRQLLNHLPNHQCISDKGKLLENLKAYCEKHEKYLFRHVPVTFILDFSKDDVEDEIKRFIQFYWEYSEDCNPEEEDKRESKNLVDMRKKMEGTIDSPKKAIKKGDIRSSRKNMKGQKIEQPYPEYSKKREETRVLYKSLIQKMKPIYNFQDMSVAKRQSPFLSAVPHDIYGDTSLWLLKPSDLNRGRGIHLFNNIEQLGDLLKVELAKNEKNHYILQKYIEKPLLILERKFDIRMWGMVSQGKQVFFFKEGYIRMSSEKYSMGNKSCFTHLTNNAVQKNAANYGEFEEGNILPLHYLYQQGHITKQLLYSQMKSLFTISLRSSFEKLFTHTQKTQPIQPLKSSNFLPKTKHFQIFGYDFMIDQTGHVWLIEINTNPCLELSNKWLSQIVPRMLDDGLKLTVDKMFMKKKEYYKDNCQPLSVEGYGDEENMWEPIAIFDHDKQQ